MLLEAVVIGLLQINIGERPCRKALTHRFVMRGTKQLIEGFPVSKRTKSGYGGEQMNTQVKYPSLKAVTSPPAFGVWE
jgi:hypothetical protein